jgi:hypothetical protein
LILIALKKTHATVAVVAEPGAALENKKKIDNLVATHLTK